MIPPNDAPKTLISHSFFSAEAPPLRVPHHFQYHHIENQVFSHIGPLGAQTIGHLGKNSFYLLTFFTLFFGLKVGWNSIICPGPSVYLECGGSTPKMVSRSTEAFACLVTSWNCHPDFGLSSKGLFVCQKISS